MLFVREISSLKQFETALDDLIWCSGATFGIGKQSLVLKPTSTNRMKMLLKQFILTCVAIGLYVANVHAADIKRGVRTGSGGVDNSDGGYFEFGVDLNLRVFRERAFFGAGVVLAGDYRYRGLFFEALSPSAELPAGPFGGISIGYTLWNNDQWAVDVLGVNATSRLATGGRNDIENSPDPLRENAILGRRSFYNGAGVRFTGYFGNIIFQYRLVTDTHGGNGITSSARLGYSRQVRNWNYHGVISANYTSQETGQYWYGISEEEASMRLEAYDVNSSTVNYSAEIGAAYPVRENVVFRSTMHYTEFEDAIARSPIQDSDFIYSWSNSLSYVF